MTEWQARQEARTRWRPEAFVEETMAGFYVRSHERVEQSKPFRLGRVMEGSLRRCRSEEV